MTTSAQQIVLPVVCGLLGLALGSFFNVVGHRLPIGQSPWSPSRSYCPHCDHQLSAADNVPLLSYLWLRGRCRYCREPISLRYPLIELASAGLFAGVAVMDGWSPVLAPDLVFVATCVVVTAADVEHRIIPNNVLLVAVGIGAPLQAWARPDEALQWAIAAVAGFAAMLLIALVYPAGMGMGDVKFAGVLGLFLGKLLIPAMLLAFLAGTIVGIGVMARRGVAQGRKTAIPFGPFMALGGVIALFAGQSLIDAYTRTITGG